eukprot:12460439-Alexandrium_andersonii.AAC.1
MFRRRSPRERFEPPDSARNLSAEPPDSARNSSGSHPAVVSARVRASEERLPGAKGGTSTLVSLRPGVCSHSEFRS